VIRRQRDPGPSTLQMHASQTVRTEHAELDRWYRTEAARVIAITTAPALLLVLIGAGLGFLLLR
jgi:hypothetical protein